MSHLSQKIEFCQWLGNSHGSSSQGNNGKVSDKERKKVGLEQFNSFLFRVPNAVDGHDSPELEIYGMDGIPLEDLQRHLDGLPIVPYIKSKLIIGDSSILPILAAQKASVAAQLAESKNMTVTGEAGGAISGISGISSAVATAAPLISPVLSSSSASASGVIVSPPLAAAVPPTVTSPPTQPPNPFWNNNNPYMMAAAYYQQYQQPQSAGGVPHNAAATQAAYAQYYQNYYQAYAAYQSSASSNTVSNSAVSNNNVSNNAYANTNINTTTYANSTDNNNVSLSVPSITLNSENRLTIPPYVDPRTSKPIPGTIFTVLDLERSMEEIRSELKRYKRITNE